MFFMKNIYLPFLFDSVYIKDELQAHKPGFIFKHNRQNYIKTHL